MIVSLALDLCAGFFVQNTVLFLFQALCERTQYLAIGTSDRTDGSLGVPQAFHWNPIPCRADKWEEMKCDFRGWQDINRGNPWERHFPESGFTQLCKWKMVQTGGWWGVNAVHFIGSWIPVAVYIKIYLPYTTNHSEHFAKVLDFHFLVCSATGWCIMQSPLLIHSDLKLHLASSHKTL